MLAWDCALTTDSRPAALYEMWLTKLSEGVHPKPADDVFLQMLEKEPDEGALAQSLAAATAQLEKDLGPDRKAAAGRQKHRECDERGRLSPDQRRFVPADSRSCRLGPLRHDERARRVR